ncbi:MULTISPECIES: hypothetical protein [Cellulomonas]|uniref:DNA-directed RNA polymerase subunit beta n=1 Tax=Cellulomonas oligotrophica TaxID=931536 RepID=A0A7Y9FED9_9CELL|nr:hypothetical protein [Cellulomonas oligotrophica]TQL03178.1 hypothetical protein FBY24_2272 [Cellulomonas sp. SLBN-39]GIG31298.1 hypothetical protein Col01nite_04570 [Cellulomonas oligotrophica]
MTTDDSRAGGRPHRPVLRDPAAMAAVPGPDPVLREEVAHTTAAALVRAGRQAQDPDVVARLVALVETEGLDVVAELWSDSPAGTLPGALWRLYLLREWVVRDPQVVADRYRQGVAAAPVHDAVAGVVSPPGPADVRAVADAVLSGVYTGDLAVALERAAAFCQVLATGTAFDADHLDVLDPGAARRTTRGAASLVRTAEELAEAAHLWRADRLV